MEELRQVLPGIAKIPTLMIWGTADNAVDPASAEPLSRQFENCHLQLLPGVGHLPYEEAPDEFNQTIVQFLQTAPEPLVTVDR
jgi:pimeloyl-ACP methyl ester carboxylesterase